MQNRRNFLYDEHKCLYSASLFGPGKRTILMKKLLIEEQALSTNTFYRELTEPRLYLSSTQAGWEGLVAQAFHEPREMKSWRVFPSGDIMLLLYAGGPLHAERRWPHSPWKGEDIYPGDMVLNWGKSPPYEIRWRSLSNVPTQALDIHLSRALVNRVAEEVVSVISPRTSRVSTR